MQFGVPTGGFPKTVSTTSITLGEVQDCGVRDRTPIRRDETSMTATSSGVSPTSRERPIVRYTTEQMLHALLRLNPETQLLPPGRRLREDLSTTEDLCHPAIDPREQAAAAGAPFGGSE